MEICQELPIAKKQNRESLKLGKAIFFAFWIVYLGLSIYEGYINAVLGSVTRFFLIGWTGYLILTLLLSKRKFVLTGNQILMGVWILYYFCSLLWTPGFSQASLYVLTVVIMVVLYEILQLFPYKKSESDFLVSIYKIWSVSLAVLAIFFSQEAIATRKVLVLFGNYIDPNNQVALMAVGSGLCLYSFFKTAGKRKLLEGVGFLICAFSIFQCGSRSGIVILAAQIIIVLFFLRDRRRKPSKTIFKWIAIIAFIVVAFYLMRQFLPQNIIDRLLGLGDLEFTDGTGRTERWAEGFKYFLEHPIFGCGWGAYECHNTFLTFLADLGILGNIPFYIVLCSLGIKAIKERNVVALLLLASGLLPGVLIGAQNRRFFWNAFILSTIVLRADNKGKKNALIG